MAPGAKLKTAETQKEWDSKLRERVGAVIAAGGKPRFDFKALSTRVTIVSLSTYLGSQGRSFLAAFASTFPAITGATFVLIYLNGGNDAIVSYAKNLLWFVPPWMVYVVSMIAGVPRFGFWPAMIGSLVLYLGCVGLVKLVLR